MCLAVSATPYVSFALGCLITDQVAPAALGLRSRAANYARGLLGCEQVAAAPYEPIWQPNDEYGQSLCFSSSWCGTALTGVYAATLLPGVATALGLGASSLAAQGLSALGKGLLGLARG